MAETATRTVYQIDVTGADAGARSMQNLAQSMGKTEQAFTKLSKPANDNARAFASMSQSSQRATAVMAAFGGAAAKLSPELQLLGQSVGRATGAIGQMTAMLGGPAGLLAGGAIAALGLFAGMLSEARKRSDELAEAQKKLAEEVTAASKAMTESNKRFLDVDNTPAGLQRQIEDKQRRLGELNKQGGFGTVKGFGVDVTTGETPMTRTQMGQVTQLQTEIADLQERRKRALEEQKKRGGAKEPGATYGGISEYEAQLRALEAAEAESKERGAIVGRMRTSDEMPQRRGETANDRFLKANKSKFDEHLAEARDTHKELEVYEKARMDAMAQYREASISGFKDIGSAGIQAFAALARGDKNVGKQLVATVGNILVGRGTDALWQGIIMSANPLTPGLGAPLIAAGVGAIAAGVAMGAAGGSSAGGGGGGSGVTSRPAAPATPNNAVTNTAGGQRPIVVNMPTVVAPGPHDGVRVRQALREAERHGV